MKCFLFFTKPNQIFIESLKENDILFTLGSKIISDPNCNPTVLSRLCSIFQHLFEACPDQSEEGCGFLFTLLDRVDNTGVFDLFKSICCMDSEMKAIQKSLVESKFSVYVARLLETATNEIIIGNLLTIISYGANNKVMWSSFCVKEVCEVVVKLTLKDDTVFNEKWNAAASLICNATYELMTPLIDKSIEIIATLYLNPKPALTFATDYLQKMFRRIESEFNEEKTNKIILSIINMMASLPDMTNLMGTVFKLISALFNSKVYREHALEMILPLITSEAPSRVRSAASAHCASILVALQAAAKKDEELAALLAKYDEFTELSERFLPWYNDVITKNYGGPMINQQHPILMTTF